MSCKMFDKCLDTFRYSETSSYNVNSICFRLNLINTDNGAFGLSAIALLSDVSFLSVSCFSIMAGVLGLVATETSKIIFTAYSPAVEASKQVYLYLKPTRIRWLHLLFLPAPLIRVTELTFFATLLRLQYVRSPIIIPLLFDGIACFSQVMRNSFGAFAFSSTAIVTDSLLS